MVAFDLWDHLGRRVTPMLAVYATATVVVTVAAGTRLPPIVDSPQFCVSAASPICSDFQTFCPDWLHFGHFLCFGGIAASQLSLRIFPIYF